MTTACKSRSYSKTARAKSAGHVPGRKNRKNLVWNKQTNRFDGELRGHLAGQNKAGYVKRLSKAQRRKNKGEAQ